MASARIVSKKTSAVSSYMDKAKIINQMHTLSHGECCFKQSDDPVDASLSPTFHIEFLGRIPLCSEYQCSVSNCQCYGMSWQLLFHCGDKEGESRSLKHSNTRLSRTGGSSRWLFHHLRAGCPDCSSRTVKCACAGPDPNYDFIQLGNSQSHERQTLVDKLTGTAVVVRCRIHAAGHVKLMHRCCGASLPAGPTSSFESNL